MNLVLGALVPNWVSSWLTPIWLLGVGALAGFVVLLLLWGIDWLLTRPLSRDGGLRRSVDEIPLAIREGVLTPILAIAGTFALFGLIGALVAQRPVDLLAALPRVLAAGNETYTFLVPATPRDEEGDVDATREAVIDAVQFRGDEVRRLTVRSTEDLSISLTPATDIGQAARQELRVPANGPYVWERAEFNFFTFGGGEVDELYVTNFGGSEAEVSIELVTTSSSPEVLSIPITATALIVIVLLYILQRSVAPRLSAIALSTYKSEVAQPLFSIILMIGLFALLVSVILPYNTFGEDIKMLKDSGFSWIMFLALVQSIWAASTSVSEEIEGRTALTVLSKPIKRRSFVLGKFLGIGWTVALLFIALGLFFLVLVAYKPLYDAVEGSKTDPSWQLCYYEMAVTVPGLLLSFMQTLVLAAVSVAISTRLPLLANFVICFTIFVLGNLTPLLVQGAQQQFEIVTFFAQLIATVLPNLEVFNISAAIAANAEVPIAYLGLSLLYCVIYSAIAMLLALVLFEDRDLA